MDRQAKATRQRLLLMFNKYLVKWKLTADGAPTVTRASRLLPVRREAVPLMLKIAVEAEERFGFGLMSWWNGQGAARVLELEDNALLMERAEGGQSLAALSQIGGDDKVSRIICNVVASLHAPRHQPAPQLVPLSYWFRELPLAASAYGGIFRQCNETAEALLAMPRNIGVLHGDIHHENILDFGARGWLAIDPKTLWGERGFEYANLFCNPTAAIATSPGRMRRRAKVVAEAAGLDPMRLLQWVLAYAGLSAAWKLSDGIDFQLNLTIAHSAAVELTFLPSFSKFRMAR